MTFWLHRFRKLDVTKQSHRKMLIDTFINAIYLYDDKMLITFNYKDGTKKITFSEIQEASKRDASGSDLECSPAPPSKGLEPDALRAFCFAGDLRPHPKQIEADYPSYAWKAPPLCKTKPGPFSSDLCYAY